jgi:hypothetical protein
MIQLGTLNKGVFPLRCYAMQTQGLRTNQSDTA